MKKTYYSIQQEANEADIFIFGDIVTYPYKPGDYSAGSLVRDLQALDADVINVHIDCYGGSVKEGWGIYNALKNHKAKVNTYADGFVASAALYPFLAGDNRYASQVSAFYLHEATGYASGYASEMRAAADEVEKITDIGIQAFVERAGLSEETVKKLMQRESWLDPNEALDLGIATAITGIVKDQSYSQSVRQAIIQALRAKKEPAGDPPPAGPTNTLKNFFM